MYHIFIKNLIIVELIRVYSMVNGPNQQLIK